jgi:hypothetical protein
MKITLLSLAILITMASAGQNNKKWHSGNMTTLQGIGISFQQFSGLNSRVAAYPQYKTLRDQMGTLSLGSRNVRRQFISEFTLNGASSMSGNRNKKSSTIRSLGVQMNLGYDLIKSEKFMLYPLAGIGFEGYQAKFYKDNSAVNFNDVLNSGSIQQSISAVKFTNSFVTYNLGLGFSIKPEKCNGTIGIQASYTGSFKDRAWRGGDRQELSNAPTDRLSRFQVGLVLSSMTKFMK